MYLCLFSICFEGHEFISILYCQVPPSKNKVDYYYYYYCYYYYYYYYYYHYYYYYYIPCKWVLLVQHNFVDEAVAAITTGLTNVEEGGEMEVQVCWKILLKVHLYVKRGNYRKNSHFTFLFHSILPSALCEIILGHYSLYGDKALTLQYLSGTFIMT